MKMMLTRRSLTLGGCGCCGALHRGRSGSEQSIDYNRTDHGPAAVVTGEISAWNPQHPGLSTNTAHHGAVGACTSTGKTNRSCQGTVRFPCRPVAAVGFDSIAEMMIFRFADILPYGDHWNQDRM